jgi:hypothetical protein
MCFLPSDSVVSPCGGGLEYLHHILASRMRPRKGNPVPRGYAGPLCHWEGRDGAVGIATGYGLHDHVVGVRIPAEARMFTSPYRPDRLSDPPSPGIDRPGREADHSSPTSAEVKKRGSINSLPHTPSRRGA